MALVCRKIFELPYADRLVLLGGKDGLDNVIRWVHYLEDPEYIKWIKGGELVIISGAMIKGKERELVEIVNRLYKYKASGIIINLSNYIKKVPEMVINLADNLGIPLFEMAEQIRIVDMSQSICYGIFKEQQRDNLNNNAVLEVIYGQRITEKRIERLKNIGIFNGLKYRALAISFNVINKQDISENNFYNDNNTAQIQYKLSSNISKFFKTKGENASIVLDDSIILIFLKCVEQVNIKHRIEELYGYISENVENISVTIAIGDTFDEIRDIQKCAEKTKKMLENQKGGIVDSYGDILQSLLMKVENTDEILEEVKYRLGELLNKENIENFETLRMYLKCGQNIKKTAENLFVHTNTVYYRLCKIQDILGFKFEDKEQFFQLQASMRIYELYKNTKNSL